MLSLNFQCKGNQKSKILLTILKRFLIGDSSFKKETLPEVIQKLIKEVKNTKESRRKISIRDY